MKILAQHGYGKSTKIEDGIQSGSLSGVVLSPRDELPDALAQYVMDLRERHGANLHVMMDPQFYATTVISARVRHLAKYDYYHSGLTRRHLTAQTSITRYVDEVLACQADYAVDCFVAPTVLLSSFQDPWSQIALSLGAESIAGVKRLKDVRPLFISLVMDEQALASKDGLDEVLDVLTSWDVHGYYLIVKPKDQSYPAKADEDTLANLLYLIYVLSRVNAYEVVCGYSDFVGILYHAVGAAATATGWFNSLRQFSMARFEEKSGGGPARARYTSSRLFNSLLVTPELDGIFRIGALPAVLSNTAYDTVMRTGRPTPDQWPADRSCLHHWEVLARLARSVSGDSVEDNLEALDGLIHEALAEYQRLGSVPFDPPSGPRNLPVWLTAIANFRDYAGL